MLFMVIESFQNQDMLPTYQRALQTGRALPDGVEFVENWIEATCGRAFQLMRCDDAAKLQAWVLHWRGLGVTFEIVPVVPGAQTREIVAPLISGGA